MPDEHGNRTMRVPERTLDFWRDQIREAAASVDRRTPAGQPSRPDERRQHIRSDMLTALLATTDHDDWERIAHDVGAVRQVLDELDGA